ncbi:DNA-3-methyladenine glycosylase [Filibacter tadaridae]|uniref:DNA-3-methyladenine glycosylase II n=2 Tax=Filibacter tadaridae TaxID=2483811 RepID=A0A3P5X0I5_9BACL|nr:DNA-3-methyladenine glycosylase [Filibacter tadaridae]VDC27441.1 DNA-3-methyladenine glycosylase [Filibacter tadaridae]
MDVQFSLPFTYDFDRALDRLSGDPVIAVNRESRSVRIPMKEGNVVTLLGKGTTCSPSFIVENAVDERQQEEIKSTFHFDRPLDGISAHFKGTDLEQLFREHEGTPLIKSFSLYGELMKSIIHQQLNLSFANTLLMRFVESYGDKIDGVWRYPSPERIASLDVTELRDKQFSTRKAEYVIGVSQAISEGRLDLEKFSGMEDAEVTAELITYRGVGPWTAQGFLMFGLGRPNLFPLADIGLQNALKRIWGLDRKPTKDEILAHFPDWSPYLSYAALYLWRSIE